MAFPIAWKLVLYRSIEVIINTTLSNFFPLPAVYIRRPDRRFLPLAAVVMARVAESGLGRKDLVVSLLLHQRERERERGGGREKEMNYHSSIDILL